LLYFRSKLVLASRLAGLPPPVDGVTPSIHDAVVLKSDVSRSKRLGFGAKLCTHPNQIGEVHSTFSPTTEEIFWAQRVLQAMDASKGAAVALDGKMVDRPVWLKAQRIAAAPATEQRLRF
jgi:citrate lyase subunit beta/citryl-CoA lyase